MRLAKKGSEILVAAGEKWFELRRVPGYEHVTRIAEVDGPVDLSGLADTLDVVGLDLDRAATIAERDADIWGVGLNYRRHAADLETAQPGSGPGSYLRPGNCLIDNGGTVELPAPSQSQRVTAEAELGLVVGRRCKNVSRENWREVVAGVTVVLDMTAEDVIRENPRYIPWAKGFDTFCSVGPVMVTLDEIESLESLRITTERNGEEIATATPADMKYDIGFLVEYFSAGRTLEQGTVISTGTPGAVPIETGDTVRAIVEQVGTLTHPVR